MRLFIKPAKYSIYPGKSLVLYHFGDLFQQLTSKEIEKTVEEKKAQQVAGIEPTASMSLGMISTALL